MLSSVKPSTYREEQRISVRLFGVFLWTHEVLSYWQLLLQRCHCRSSLRHLYTPAWMPRSHARSVPLSCMDVWRGAITLSPRFRAPPHTLGMSQETTCIDSAQNFFPESADNRMKILVPTDWVTWTSMRITRRLPNWTLCSFLEGCVSVSAPIDRHQFTAEKWSVLYQCDFVSKLLCSFEDKFRYGLVLSVSRCVELVLQDPIHFGCSRFCPPFTAHCRVAEACSCLAQVEMRGFTLWCSSVASEPETDSASTLDTKHGNTLVETFHGQIGGVRWPKEFPQVSVNSKGSQ